MRLEIWHSTIARWINEKKINYKPCDCTTYMNKLTSAGRTTSQEAMDATIEEHVEVILESNQTPRVLVEGSGYEVMTGKANASEDQSNYDYETVKGDTWQTLQQPGEEVIYVNSQEKLNIYTEFEKCQHVSWHKRILQTMAYVLQRDAGDELVVPDEESCRTFLDMKVAAATRYFCDLTSVDRSSTVANQLVMKPVFNVE